MIDSRFLSRQNFSGRNSSFFLQLEQLLNSLPIFKEMFFSLLFFFLSLIFLPLLFFSLLFFLFHDSNFISFIYFSWHRSYPSRMCPVIFCWNAYLLIPSLILSKVECKSSMKHFSRVYFFTNVFFHECIFSWVYFFTSVTFELINKPEWIYFQMLPSVLLTKVWFGSEPSLDAFLPGSGLLSVFVVGTMIQGEDAFLTFWMRENIRRHSLWLPLPPSANKIACGIHPLLKILSSFFGSFPWLFPLSIPMFGTSKWIGDCSIPVLPMTINALGKNLSIQVHTTITLPSFKISFYGLDGHFLFHLLRLELQMLTSWCRSLLHWRSFDDSFGTFSVLKMNISTTVVNSERWETSQLLPWV